MIVVIDYGLGNLTSVYNALKFLGAQAKISSSPEDVKKADKIVLPGVGAFGDAMAGLKKRGLAKALTEELSKGKTYLGICLGLQVLFEESEEGNVKGLGILKGKVRRFQEENRIKVPQIGWNRVDYSPKDKDYKLWDRIGSGSFFYFDHSYYAEPSDSEIVAATTNYGIKFASAILKGNINAVQFHPERSQDLGLCMLGNFLGM